MIENYGELNRDETVDAVSDFDGEQLAAFVEYEREHEDRKTVVDPLERELVDVVPANGRQYVAGVWFDDASEPETVRRSPRVKQALDEGELEVISDE
jgi:hypothetical protein